MVIVLKEANWRRWKDAVDSSIKYVLARLAKLSLAGEKLFVKSIVIWPIKELNYLGLHFLSLLISKKIPSIYFLDGQRLRLSFL